MEHISYHRDFSSTGTSCPLTSPNDIYLLQLDRLFSFGNLQQYLKHFEEWLLCTIPPWISRRLECSAARNVSEIFLNKDILATQETQNVEISKLFLSLFALFWNLEQICVLRKQIAQGYTEVQHSLCRLHSIYVSFPICYNTNMP